MQLADLVGNFAPLKGTRSFPREATQHQRFSHKAWKIPPEGQETSQWRCFSHHGQSVTSEQRNVGVLAIIARGWRTSLKVAFEFAQFVVHGN